LRATTIIRFGAVAQRALRAEIFLADIGGSQGRIGGNCRRGSFCRRSFWRGRRFVRFLRIGLATRQRGQRGKGHQHFLIVEHVSLRELVNAASRIKAL
jgi:hypothetical protein